MGQSAFKVLRNAFFVVWAVLMVGALAGWYFHNSGIHAAPALPSKPSPASRTTPPAGFDSSRATTASAVEMSPGSAVQPALRPEVAVTFQPVEQFRTDLKKMLVQQLASAYPELPDLSGRAKGLDPNYRESVFRFLDAAEKAPAAEQPAMFLAAHFMLEPLWCPSEQKDHCDQLRTQAADHKATFSYSEMGGGWYYQHGLLVRVSQDYAASEWGDRAFVLLLSLGWDTNCSKGSDQFRQVIQHGESFLEQHPSSPNRGLVAHLVGEAYTTWWLLSLDPAPGTEDYVDPKPYKEGSEQARLKAIGHFEEALQLSPETPIGEYSRQILPALRERQLGSNGGRFFCSAD